MMDTDDNIVQLLKLTSQLMEKVDNLDKRMNKVEEVVTNDVRQDQRLDNIEMSLRRGNDKFLCIEDRLNVLEDAEGNRAKSIMRTISNYLLTALLTFAGTAIVFYIMNKK